MFDWMIYILTGFPGLEIIKIKSICNLVRADRGKQSSIIRASIIRRVFHVTRRNKVPI